MKIKIISLKEVEFISFILAKELMSFNEPIPAFSTRFPHKLESSLAVPFQTFDGKDLYVGLINKASILFYLINKNHCFQNGNKRLAMTILFHFLYKNKKWLKVDNQELYKFAVWVASSPPFLKNNIINAIQDFLGKNLIKL